MKPTYIAAASSFVLALTLAGPVVADELPIQAQEQQKPQLEIEKSGDEAVGTGQVQYEGESGKAEGKTSTTAGDITGTEVVNQAGDEIGEVEEIVRDKETGSFHAVVSVGGFLGIGDKQVAIALDDLKLRDEQLLISLDSTEEQLKAYPAYEEARYEKVKDEQLVDLSSTGSQTAGVTVSSFSELDADGDGYLSKDEVAKRTAVIDQWDRIDKNQDDRVDSAEFAAFEAKDRDTKPFSHEGKPGETVPGNPYKPKEPSGQGGMRPEGSDSGSRGY
jgi:sporulation protein YlmC with PRC-barrel domain